MSLPKFNSFQIETEVVNSNECSATVTFFPLERGLGNTIGNTLRRVLLSSIPSPAVFAIRLTSLSHEFSAIKGVAEDATQLIISIKKLVLRVNEEVVNFEELKSSPIEKWPYLKVRKSNVGPVLAKDIECFPGIEVVNPELRLCEITEEGTNFELDLFCTVDRGYRSSNENRELLNTLSLIPIDTLFSPVLLVDWKVMEEKTTKYGLSDKLRLSVSTNGSIKALDAIWYSAKILVSMFERVAQQPTKLFKLDETDGKSVKQIVGTEGGTTTFKASSIASSPIESLEFSAKTLTILKNGGINTISELISFTPEKLAEIKGLEKKHMKEIQDKLKESGFKLKK